VPAARATGRRAGRLGASWGGALADAGLPGREPAGCLAGGLVRCLEGAESRGDGLEREGCPRVQLPSSKEHTEARLAGR